jgi:superfamily II DNA/RNA helicase
MIIAAVAEFVVARGEKAIIFCQNPTEQEILNCLLNLCGIKSVAHLSRYEMSERKKTIQIFNKQLSRDQLNPK